MRTRYKALILLLIAALIAIIPLFMVRGASFGGSDDAGSQMINQVTGGQYKPWFTPVLEQVINRELPPEMENLFFCVQTGIGVGIIAYIMGMLVERNRKETRAGSKKL